MIQRDSFKLTEHVESGDYSLYNLNEDPYESNEVGANHPEKLKELQKHLSIWKENTGYEAPRTNPNYIK